MNRIAVTAHSGCEGTPDNTIDSVLFGILSGADSVEVDVHLAPDGTLRLTHDASADYAALPTLRDAFRAIENTSVSINCDLKHYEALYPTIELADACALPRERFIFSGSVDPQILLVDPSVCRRARVFLNSEEIFMHMAGRKPASREEEIRFIGENLPSVAALMRDTGAEALNAPHQYMSDDLIAALRGAGIALSLWTANTEEDIRRLLDTDLLSLTTRCPSFAVTLRGSGAKATTHCDNAAKASFRYMEKAEFDSLAPALFDILADNMEKIAPTGCCREEDFATWFSSMHELLQDASRRTVLIFTGKDRLCGYFQFRAADGLFMMEEIEFMPEIQGKGRIFRDLYSFVLPALTGIEAVEAYASKNNARSAGILLRLGLKYAGENKSGRSWHFRGGFADLLRWHARA